MRDFGAMKSVASVILKTKTDYLFRLPYMLQGLAMVDEAKAREVGARAIQAFDADRANQDDLTKCLLNPDTEFRGQLEMFVNGVARNVCSRNYCC